MLPGIICRHITDSKPPLVVEHDFPCDEAEAETGGWVITCGAGLHPDADLKLVDLDRYFAKFPELQPLRESLPLGQMASRTRAGSRG